MCLLVVQTNIKGQQKSKLIPKEIFEAVWEGNPHGFGTGWFTKNGTPIMCHSLKLIDAWEMYNRQYNQFHGHMIVHWRFSTHGSKTLENCHPFLTSNDTPCILGHNGIISPTPDCPPDWSDTRWFAKNLKEIMLKESKNQDFKDPKNEKEIKYYLGSSRLAIIQPNWELHTWNFPNQEEVSKEYGLFSIGMSYRMGKRPTTGRCYHSGTGPYNSYNAYDNWNTSGPRGPSSQHPEYVSRGHSYTSLPYVNPQHISKDVFMLPSTFWLFEVLETNAYCDFENVLCKFHTRFDRFPTSSELEAAVSMTTKNKKLKPSDKPVQKTLTLEGQHYEL